MNHFKMFFNTRIKQTGLLAALGNFFLIPIRFMFSGKTIAPQGLTIAKVKSFYLVDEGVGWEAKKFAKQNNTPVLESSSWGFDMDLIIFPLMALIFVIPGLIFGSILKGLSYLSSETRKTHSFVKGKLTPLNKVMGSNLEPCSPQNLKIELENYLSTAQKTQSLIIYHATVLDKECSELVRKINPFNVILINTNPSPDEKNATNTIEHEFATMITHSKKSHKWNLDGRHKKNEAFKSSNNSSSMQAPLKAAMEGKRSGFFEKKHRLFVLTADEAKFMEGLEKNPILSVN